MVKNAPANAGDKRDKSLIPAMGRSPAGGHGKSLQYSYLENPINRGAWWLQPMGLQRVRQERVTKYRAAQVQWYFNSDDGNDS